MTIEHAYREVLVLTQAMREAANAQHWEELTQLEQQRSTRVASLSSPPLEADQVKRIAEIIDEIERESREILEHVQVWQKHVRILLRLDRPTAQP